MASYSMNRRMPPVPTEVSRPIWSVVVSMVWATAGWTQRPRLPRIRATRRFVLGFMTPPPVLAVGPLPRVVFVVRSRRLVHGEGLAVHADRAGPGGLGRVDGHA